VLEWQGSRPNTVDHGGTAARWWKRMLKEPEAQMSSATQNTTKTLAKTKSKVVHWGAQIAKRRSKRTWH